MLSTPDDPARAVIERPRADARAARTPRWSPTARPSRPTRCSKRKARASRCSPTRGFEDLIEIGRQNRDDLYALSPSRPEPLVARAMRFGVDERTLFDGSIAKPLTPRGTRAHSPARGAQRRRSLRHLPASFVRESEKRGVDRASARSRSAGRSRSRIASSPNIANSSGFSTTVVNAYVAPRMSSHLKNLEPRLEGARLRVMQSNGSAIGVELAREEPVRTILSGPAAGVIGAGELARAIRHRSLHHLRHGRDLDRRVDVRSARANPHAQLSKRIRGAHAGDRHSHRRRGRRFDCARSTPAARFASVPESAGADPGPACYGRGDLPHRHRRRSRRGTDRRGEFPRRPDEDFSRIARRASMRRLARAMKTTPTLAARGVIRVVNANMERAIRVITVERGFDPRDFALLAFGGAGPMHACELALDLGIRQIVLPRNPGLLCAWGALGAPLGREYSMTMRDDDPNYRKSGRRAPPTDAPRATLNSRPKERARDSIMNSAPTCAIADSPTNSKSRSRRASSRSFIRRISRTFGHSSPELRRRSGESPPARSPLRAVDRSAEANRAQARKRRRPSRHRHVWSAAENARCRSMRETRSARARACAGRSIIVELSSTAYVAPEFALRVDDFGNLHLEAAR